MSMRRIGMTSPKAIMANQMAEHRASHRISPSNLALNLAPRHIRLSVEAEQDADQITLDNDGNPIKHDGKDRDKDLAAPVWKPRVNTYKVGAKPACGTSPAIEGTICNVIEMVHDNGTVMVINRAWKRAYKTNSKKGGRGYTKPVARKASSRRPGQRKSA